MTSDATLVQACLAGRTQAFAGLVDRYQQVIYNVALRMVNHAADAEDITQTVFVKAYEKLDTYKPQYKFYSWLYRMAVNESLNHRARQRPVEGLDETVFRSDVSSEGALLQHEQEDRVGRALMELKPEDRAIVLLRHVQGFSYSEIAFILDLPEKKVKSRLFTARKRLKNILVQHGFARPD